MTMPAELRDKMLRLLGGCEHEPVMKDFLHLQCQKCYEFWLDGKTKDGNEPPTVGDGHEPTTDELLDLCVKLEKRLGGLVEVTFGCDEGGWWAVLRWDDGKVFHRLVGTATEDYNSPAFVLATAIDKAVKGERG